MTNFSIFIPRVDNCYTSNDIAKELCCYGLIKSIYKINPNNYDNYTSVVITYEFTVPISSQGGRTLHEDIIYRETNKLKPFIHWGNYGGWGLLRNLEKPNNININKPITDNFIYCKDSIMYDNVYAAGL